MLVVGRPWTSQNKIWMGWQKWMKRSGNSGFLLHFYGSFFPIIWIQHFFQNGSLLNTQILLNQIIGLMMRMLGVPVVRFKRPHEIAIMTKHFVVPQSLDTISMFVFSAICGNIRHAIRFSIRLYLLVNDIIININKLF